MNGCGLTSVRELVLFNLNENAVSGNTWYRSIVRYTKQGRATVDGEVNYSFDDNITPGDSWLGKLVYTPLFNKKSCDPAGLC